MVLLLPFLVELEFGNDGFWEAGKSGVHKEQPLGAKERTNNKLNRYIWHRRQHLNPSRVEASSLPSTPSVFPGSLCCPWVRILWPSGVITAEIHALGYSRTKQTQVNSSKPTSTREVNYVECMFCSYNFLDGRDKKRIVWPLLWLWLQEYFGKNCFKALKVKGVWIKFYSL